MNRETWLLAAIEELRPLFDAAGSPLTRPVRVAMGFPSSRAFSAKNPRIGECWHAEASADGTVEMIVSPVLDDPLVVLATLAHEQAHAILGQGVGHRAPFTKLVRKIGLEGKPTATHAGPVFIEQTASILQRLGPLPHARITGNGSRKKQTTRLVKCECSECGYIARTSRQWLDDAGPPICPTDRVQMRCE